MAPSVSVLTETGFHSIVSFPHPHSLVRSVNKSPAHVTLYFHKRVQGRGTQRQFSENVFSEVDLRSRIFGTFVVKFLACLPLLGFSNI